jgi:hypothetical protein
MAANLTNNTRVVRIPYGFASDIVSIRAERGEHIKKATGKAYRTNRIVRAAAFFAYLKTLTTSGKVSINPKLFSYETGLSLDTVRARVGELVHVYGWATYADKGASLLLNAWQTVCRTVESGELTEVDEPAAETPPCAKHIFRWQVGNFNQLLYVFAALEIRENKEKQEYMYDKNVRNLGLRNQLESIGLNTRESHAAAQRAAFSQRSEHPAYIVLALNADTERAVNTIRKAHGLKSRRSAGYLKKRLHLLGLVTVTQRRFTSAVAAWTKSWHTAFGKVETSKRTTFFPDLITLNPALFG